MLLKHQHHIEEKEDIFVSDNNDSRGLSRNFRKVTMQQLNSEMKEMKAYINRKINNAVKGLKK